MKHRLLHLALILALTLPMFSIMLPGRASAAGISANDIKNADLSWVDRNTLKAKVGSEILIFKSGSDDNHTYSRVYKVQDYPCYGEVWFDIKIAAPVGSGTPVPGKSDKPPTSGNLDLDYQPGSAAGNVPCQNVGNPGDSIKRPISHPNNFGVYFTVSDDGRHINAVSGDSNHNYTQSNQYPDIFLRDSEANDTCQDVIKVDASNGTYKSYELTSSSSSGNKPPADAHAPGCYYITGSGYVEMGVSLRLGNPSALQKDVNPNPPPGGTGGGVGPANGPTCDSGDFSFNWALCPIFDGTNAVTNWIFTNLIQPLLMTNPICLDPAGTSCDNTIYKIWSGFRIYGDIFLVIVLLVIVFGESIGGGMIDAYTAKKVLPRLLIAAILINLSVYIVALAIDITNVVGGGLGQLLTAPLQGNGAFKIQPDGITQGAIAAFGATGLLVGGFVLGVTGIALLMVGLIITGAIAMVGIFITLILRQTIILALLLISPVAFALWCLPNTQSWFKRWWDTLFQMLLVYPMIIVLFAVADIMSYVTQHNGTGGVLSSIVAFMLLIIPLYMVPFTLRSSNRLLGAVHGAVSNVGRQLNGVTGKRALGAAGREMEKNINNAGNYSRFSNRNALTRGINTLTGTAAHPRSLLRGQRGVRASRQARQTAFGAEAIKENEIFQANQGDDKFLLAVANRDLAEQKLAATRQKFEAARASGDMEGMISAQSTMDAQQHALDAAAQMGATGRTAGARYQALQSLAKTGFQFEAGQAGYQELSDTVRQLSGGDERAYSAMMNESQYNLRTAGRFDLGGINDGAGYNPRAGTNKASLYQLAQAKPESIHGMMDGIDMSASSPTIDHGVLYKELEAMLPNSTGSTRDAIKENMDRLEGLGVREYVRANEEVIRREGKPRTYERPRPEEM